LDLSFGVKLWLTLSCYGKIVTHWVMSHDSAKHKQNGVNYIRSESSNRLGVEYTYGTPMSVLPSFAERKR